MPWKVEVPYDHESPYMFDDASDAASFICGCDVYQENYEYDEDSYQELIDENYACEHHTRFFVVNGHEYSPSEAFKAVDDDAYWSDYEEERRYYASESYDSVRDSLSMNEYHRGEAYFDGGIRCEYIDEEEIEDDDDEGHDKQEFSDCFAIG